MYKEAVGHYGMDAAYFFEKLGLQEAADFIAGAQKREREPWERCRYLSNVVAVLLSGSPTKLTFPWEEPSEEELAAQTAEAIEAAKAMEKMVESGAIKF